MRRSLFIAATFMGIFAALPATATDGLELIYPPNEALLREQSVIVVGKMPAGSPLPGMTVGPYVLPVKAVTHQSGEPVYFHAMTTVVEPGPYEVVVSAGHEEARSRVFIADPLVEKAPATYSELEFHLDQKDLAGRDKAGCSAAECHAYDFEADTFVEAKKGCRVCHFIVAPFTGLIAASPATEKGGVEVLHLSNEAPPPAQRVAAVAKMPARSPRPGLTAASAVLPVKTGPHQSSGPALPPAQSVAVAAQKPAGSPPLAMAVASAVVPVKAAPRLPDGLELLHPPNGALLRDQNVAVVAWMPAGSRFPSMTVGRHVLPVKAVTHRSGGPVYFHAMTTVVEPGPYEVVVSAGDEKARAWVFVADPLVAKVPPKYSELEFHLEQNSRSAAGNAGCAADGCHAYDLVEDDPVEAGKGCRVCHPRDGEYRHAPARLGECYLCHSTTDYKPTREAANSCLLCHDDVKQAFKTAAFTHGPAHYQECALCHNPHGERQTMMTWRGRNGTCVTCHKDYDKMPHVVGGIGGRSAGHPIDDVKNPLSPTEEFSCAGCHNPHTSEHAMMYNYGATDRLTLCKKCHEGKY